MKCYPIFPLTFAALFPDAALQAAQHHCDHVVTVVEENRAIGSIISDREILPVARRVPADGGSAPEITFLRRRTGDLIYTAEFSSNIENWEAGGISRISYIDTNWEQVSIRDAAGSTSPIGFARVRVAQTP